MSFKNNQIKVFSICYSIIEQEKHPLLKVLFIDYCKKHLTEKQFILALMIAHLIHKNNMSKDPLYEFMKGYIFHNKHTIIKQLLYVQ